MPARDEILRWLRETDGRRLDELWRRADAVRRRCVGDAVHLRGLIEVSNYCVRQCAYCGIRGPNDAVRRYRMTADEVLAAALRAEALGYGTVVLQSGEDPHLTAGRVAGVIRRIKAATSLAVTLSLGERSDEDLRLWREAGADRYLLRFETSNRALYERIHPPRHGQPFDRVAALHRLRGMGYEVGSGILVGLPGQTVEMLADDILLLAELDLDMIGLGPYIEHPRTPMPEMAVELRGAGAEQAPPDELTTCKVLALARLACPYANLPSTTALATLDSRNGRQLGLACGANVVMPNVTPARYGALYEIYPGKACVGEDEDFDRRLKKAIVAMGREIGTGRGDSPRYTAAQCGGNARA